MSALFEIIRLEIGKNGPITFSRFMELCLYHPQHGYYRKKSLPIGKTGDYYTSPTVHKLFGYLIARQIKEIVDSKEFGKITFVEAGAGKGHLARDIGEYFKNYEKDIHNKLELLIIEPHTPYRDVQLKETREFYNAINFISHESELQTFDGVFYSNELFDAFPVEILEFDEGSIKQVYVDCDGKQFYELKKDVSPYIRDFLTAFNVNVSSRLRTEVSPIAVSFYKSVAEKIKKGAILTVDYGYTMGEYFSQTRNRGTLMCYYRHQAFENPYIRVGEQDMTAHVNFSMLNIAGKSAGLKTSGYTEQQYFLMGCGFIEEVEKLKSSMPQELFEQEMQKIKALIMPGGMGTTFKVLAQTKGILREDFRGFIYRNSKDQL